MAFRAIKAVTLQIYPFGLGHLVGINVIGRQKLCHAKVGVHRPFAIRGDDHDTTASFSLFRLWREGGLVNRTLSAQIMRKDRTQLVVLHLAHIGCAATQVRDASNSIGS